VGKGEKKALKNSRILFQDTVIYCESASGDHADIPTQDTVGSGMEKALRC
jgi:hypothetical protein